MYSGVEDMSGRSRRRREHMPPTSAGLLRFFEEEVGGIKLKPTVVAILSVAIITISIVLLIFF
ncbi:MAG: preprotein translocase subunit Sec61beta [Candidatus Bathyarchaeia archaeon]